MPLKCSFVGCVKFNLAQFDQLAFYQDLNTSGWNLALGPEFVLPDATLPTNIRLIDTGDNRFPYNAVCSHCHSKLGQVNLICGFERMTLNFSSKRVYLMNSGSTSAKNAKMKWSKLIDSFPTIRRITATISEHAPLVALDTVHFHSASDFEDIINAGKAVSSKSNLSPKDYQWRAFLFSCLNNVLLCLPTGMGKTLIANMLMKAYQLRNARKGQVFIVPTVVLVEQQAAAIEGNTGLKVIRRSGEEFKRVTWSPEEICVCTPAMLLNAIKVKQIDMSHLSLVVFDEAHEASSPNSQYGLLLPYLNECPASKRPRVLGLTASPSFSNSSDMRQSISSLCDKLGAVPYSPLEENSVEKPNSIDCRYISIDRTSFEVTYERFVMEFIEKLSSLHDFFKANWKTLPINWSTESKICDILKMISHAKLVAEDMRDLQLIQLINWMRKWIDSLNILQIFGPQKLIQFIRNDLDYVEKNDALSSISSQLASITNEMRISIEQMINQHQIHQNSPRLHELLKLLKDHRNDCERILIFVDRRSSAERLCRRLKEDDVTIKEMNPIFIVGNANTGVSRKDEQKSILDMFRKGESRLLIATSVLEQGIDVTMCGLVICFDGVKSLKSIIQSRGRARKDGSTFVAFVAAEKQRKANELIELEVTMNYTIRQLMLEYNCVFDSNIARELDNFLLSDDRMVTDNSVIDESDSDDDDVEQLDPNDQDVVRLRFFRFVDSKTLVDHIRTVIKSSKECVKASKTFINASFTSTKGAMDSRIIKEISTVADDSMPASRLSSWFQVFFTTNETSDCETVIFDQLTGFYFRNSTTVSYDSNSIWSEKFELNIRNKEIVLSTDNRQFHLYASDFDTILINDTINSFELFLCLRNPPIYFIDKQQAHFDFVTRSFNLGLKRKTSIDSNTSAALRNALRPFSLEIYNVCHLKSTTEENHPAYDVDSDDFLMDYHVKVWHSKYSAILPTILPHRILKQLHGCSSSTSLKVALNNTIPIRFQKLEIKSVKNVELPFSDWHSDEYVSIGRIHVTPTRFIYLPMQPIQKNRVFRYFPDPKNFLLISFTDERGSNPWRSSYVYEWFLSVLKEGIKVGRKRFTFLGCSNSQLREGHCWFSSLDRDDVYKKIGECPDTWSAGRKLTRLALAFASSFQTVTLDYDRYLKTVASDVEIDGVNFSDGIGRASHALCVNIQNLMKLPEKPSAYQIRVGGIKGVVSVFDQEDDVTFRKSMKKFESNHNTLEVLNYSRSIPLFLNRHVILLLSSYGIPDEVFLDLQHNQLVKCIDTLHEGNSSLALVKSKTDIFDWELFPQNHLIREPFFLQILFCNLIDLISGITSHAHIPISSGRILMGVMDETNTLEYGEIYAHIVENDFDYEVEGRVVVFRNPCVLPSDIRVLNAVGKDSMSRLKNLYKNCIVFPSHGPSSHASECSGGDLDGDLYHIIWDSKLIPENLQVPGEKVIAVDVKETVKIQVSSSHESMMSFYCDYVSKNQLGMIANAHLAVADDLGMRHPNCVDLAKYVTAEVDAPKKGLTVGKIPKDMLPSRYPDFMEKSDKPIL